MNTKCPYTGKEMKDPVRNKHCNHNYDREGANQLIRARGARAKYVQVTTVECSRVAIKYYLQSKMGKTFVNLVYIYGLFAGVLWQGV